jgi:hypothetical protein
MTTASLSPVRIKRTIFGGGLGVGLGLIGVAYMAVGRMQANRPERLIDEMLMLLMGFFTGLALGWMAGARSTSKIRLRMPVAYKALPVAQSPCYFPEPVLAPVPASGIAWATA